MRPLVILRPEPGASATAGAAREIGLAPLVMPLFRIESIGWQAPGDGAFDSLLLTSANAVRAGGNGLAGLMHLPAYCVGETTAAAARAAGFAVEGVGSGGIDELLASLPASLRLLHLCGADRRPPANARQSISAVPVYRATELPDPKGLDRIDGAVVVVHSPRAAARLRTLADLLSIERNRTAIAAISEPAAAALGSGWEQVEVAASPTDAALLSLAARLCNNRR